MSIDTRHFDGYGEAWTFFVAVTVTVAAVLWFYSFVDFKMSLSFEDFKKARGVDSGPKKFAAVKQKFAVDNKDDLEEQQHKFCSVQDLLDESRGMKRDQLRIQAHLLSQILFKAAIARRPDVEVIKKIMTQTQLPLTAKDVNRRYRCQKINALEALLTDDRSRFGRREETIEKFRMEALEFMVADPRVRIDLDIINQNPAIWHTSIWKVVHTMCQNPDRCFYERTTLLRFVLDRVPDVSIYMHKFLFSSNGEEEYFRPSKQALTYFIEVENKRRRSIVEAARAMVDRGVPAETVFTHFVPYVSLARSSQEENIAGEVDDLIQRFRTECKKPRQPFLDQSEVRINSILKVLVQLSSVLSDEIHISEFDGHKNSTASIDTQVPEADSSISVPEVEGSDAPHADQVSDSWSDWCDLVQGVQAGIY